MAVLSRSMTTDCPAGIETSSSRLGSTFPAQLAVLCQELSLPAPVQGREAACDDRAIPRVKTRRVGIRSQRGIGCVFTGKAKMDTDVEGPAWRSWGWHAMDRSFHAAGRVLPEVVDRMNRINRMGLGRPGSESAEVGT